MTSLGKEQAGLGDQMVLYSDYYPEMYNQLVTQQGEAKRSRRRRKKNKLDEEGSSGGNGGLTKRKLSQEQVRLLELNFESEHKLESERKDRLASELGLDPRQVAVWFQNRRARFRSKKLEEEYAKLKAENDNTVVHKCRLETEVLQLKEQLYEMEKENQRLMGICDMVSSNSPSSSFSVEAMEPPFLGEFGMEGLESILYVPQNNYVEGMEWVHLM